MGELLGRKRLVAPKSGTDALLRVRDTSLTRGWDMPHWSRPIGRTGPIPTSWVASGLIPASRFPDRPPSKALPTHPPGRQSFAQSGFHPAD
jgi:hypothetical protein